MSLTPAVGWYASDDGLVLAWAAPHRKAAGEARRLFMDFAPVSEVVAGDTVSTGAAACPGLTITDVQVVGTRVYATAAGGTGPTEYPVQFTANLSGGSAIVRSGALRVEGL